MLLLDGVETCVSCQKEIWDKELEKELLSKQRQREAFKAKSWLSQKSVFDGEESISAEFDAFKARTEDEMRCLNAARQLTKEISNEDASMSKGANIWLVGKPGSGKTHLAVSMLKELNKTGNTTCLFVSSKLLFSLIRKSFDDPTELRGEHYYTKLMTGAEVLVIDDIGKETGSSETNRKASDFVTRVLNTVIDARRGKVTIYTTNLSFDKLVYMYDEALVDRMKVNHALVKFTGIASKRATGGRVF